MKAYSYEAVRNISEMGIFLKDGYFIDFSACILNFHRQFGNKSTACVGVRDYAAVPPYFIFFAETDVKIIFDLHKGLYAKTKNQRDFQRLQIMLQNRGMTTYDLS